MSFPLVYWGPDGEQYNTYADPTIPGEPRYRLGQQLVLRDGRKFRFCRNGGATQVAGEVCQAAAGTANQLDMAVATAGVVGDTSLAVTLGGSTVSADDYMDGTLYTVGTAANGGGYSYAIAEHSNASVSTAWTVNFAPGVTLQVATPTAGFAVAMRSPYRNIIRIPVTTMTNVPVGVAVSVPTANKWCWIQTRGSASVFYNGTLVLGNQCGYNGVAAAVNPFAADINAAQGTVQAVSTKTFSPVFLTIDG